MNKDKINKQIDRKLVKAFRKFSGKKLPKDKQRELMEILLANCIVMISRVLNMMTTLGYIIDYPKLTESIQQAQSDMTHETIHKVEADYGRKH